VPTAQGDEQSSSGSGVLQHSVKGRPPGPSVVSSSPNERIMLACAAGHSNAAFSNGLETLVGALVFVPETTGESSLHAYNLPSPDDDGPISIAAVGVKIALEAATLQGRCTDFVRHVERCGLLSDVFIADVREKLCTLRADLKRRRTHGDLRSLESKDYMRLAVAVTRTKTAVINRLQHREFAPAPLSTRQTAHF
jgi:hypothetical protein